MNSNPHKKYITTRRIVIVSGILVTIIIFAGIGYWFYKNHKSSKTSKNNQNNIAQKPSPSASPQTTSTSTQYVSNGKDLNLTFSYLSDWSATPSSNNNPSDQTITVTSPLFSNTTAAGTTVTAKIVVQVRPKSATIDELNANSPIAAIASSQIAYSQPSSTQRQYPYLSYIHFSTGSNVKGAFEEVMLTGGQNFTQGSPISIGYLNGLDPIISASFYQCSTQSCSGSGQTPMSIVNDTWQNSSNFQHVLDLFKSFKLS